MKTNNNWSPKKYCENVVVGTLLFLVITNWYVMVAIHLIMVVHFTIAANETCGSAQNHTKAIRLGDF